MNIVKNIVEIFENLLNVTEEQKKPVLVIVNDDHDYGLYVQKLVRLFNKYNVKLRSKEEFKSIKTDDVIILGDGFLFEGGEAFDARVEKYPYRVLADKRYDVGDNGFNVIDLVANMKKIEGYLYENYSVSVPEMDVTRTEVLRAVSQQGVDYIANTDLLNLLDELDKAMNVVPEPEPIVCKPDIHVHDNFVKIGYNTYRVYNNTFGGKFIIVGGVKYDIVTDRFGRKGLRKQ